MYQFKLITLTTFSTLLSHPTKSNKMKTKNNTIFYQ